MSSLRNCPDDSDDSDFVWDGFCSMFLLFFILCKVWYRDAWTKLGGVRSM